MNARSLLATIAVLSGAVASHSFAAPVPVLNFPGDAGTYVQYGDFRSYSMPILDWISTSQGGPEYLFNTANTIQDALVVGTGSGGNKNNQDLGLVGVVSNGYDFPNKVGTDKFIPQDASFTGWTISLTALRDYLTDSNGVKHDLVAYFNNNQVGTSGTAPDGTLMNNLWAWAQVDLVGTGNTQSFYLKDTASTLHRLDDPTTGSINESQPFGHGDYALSGGMVTLCFSSATPDPAFEITCPITIPNNITTKEFSHNLGQNSISYAAFSEGLNNLLWSTNYTEMRVRADFLDLNNGFENLFFGAACVAGTANCKAPPPDLPEPGTIALFGLALASLGLMRRRKS